MRFLMGRLLGMLPTLVVVFLLVAVLVRLVPGDPVNALLGDRASPADREAMMAVLGLDKPWWEQVMSSFFSFAKGDFGVSVVSGKPVAGLLWERFPATFLVAVASMGVAVAVGLVFGVILGVARARVRALGDALLLAVMAIPTFCLGPFLVMFFAVRLGFFPVSGAEGRGALVLPSITLGLGMGAVLARMLMVSIVDVLGQDYVKAAVAKGAAFPWVIWRHVFRNAMVPVVVLFFLQLGMVLTGTVLTEAVFGWPGLGSLLVEALHQRDYPVIQACLLLISLVYMLAMLLADVVSLWVDPRLRRGA